MEFHALRAADGLVGCAGRSTLVLVLRGSKAKKILPYSDNPAHGKLAERSVDEVSHCVDW